MVTEIFINDVENEIIYIDKAGLKEIIDHHKPKFEIIGGHYYDQGRNNTINHVIEDLYNLRLKLKRDKIQYRLLLNC